MRFESDVITVAEGRRALVPLFGNCPSATAAYLTSTIRQKARFYCQSPTPPRVLLANNDFLPGVVFDLYVYSSLLDKVIARKNVIAISN